MKNETNTRARWINRRHFLRLCVSGAALPLTGCGFLDGIFKQSTPTPGSMFVEQPTAAAQRPTATAAIASKTTIILNAPNIGIRPVLENFERDNPDYTVQYITKSNDQASQELFNALKYGDNVPDLAVSFPSGIGRLLPFDGLHDLIAAPFDAGKFENEIVPGLWQSGKMSGKQMFIPWACSPGVLLYRYDLLKAAGIDGEVSTLESRVKSWDDMLLLAQEYKQKQPERPFFLNAHDLFYGMLAQKGYNFIDGRKVLIEELATAPARLAARVRELKLDAKQRSNVDLRQSIKGQEFVAMIGSLGTIGYLASAAPDTTELWRVLRLPGGTAFFGGLLLSVPAKAQNPQPAWRLLRYLVTNVQSQLDWLANLGLVPCYKPSWETPLINQGLPFLGGQQIYKLAVELVAAMPRMNFSPYDNDVQEIVEGEITQVIDMGKEPGQAMRDAEKKVIQKGQDLVG